MLDLMTFGDTLGHVMVAKSMREKVKELVRKIPWLHWAAQHARRLLYSSGVLLLNEPLMRLAELYLRRYYAFDTQRLWSGPHPPPEWFDHRADLYRWSELRNSFWVERGIFSQEVMFEGCQVLDLCCGDGFYSYHFYAKIAEHVDAIDRDLKAIIHARKWHKHPKINYVQMDVVTEDFPQSYYDVIILDAAIEHFLMDEIRTVLRKCVNALRKTGVLHGYTLIARSSTKSHPEHKHEFSSTEELKELLGEFFPFVGTVETEYPERTNIYFRAAFDPTRLRRFE